MSSPARNPPPTLNSWKEIATFLGRGVRTVQRWEAESNLPVHRVGKGKRSPVFAFPAELLLWARTVESEGPVDRRVNKERPSHNPAVNRSRLLIKQSADLVRSLAVSTAKQREQAESLFKRVSALQSFRRAK